MGAAGGFGLGAGDGRGTFSFKGFRSFGRYFRLFAAGNYGAAKIEVRELTLRGPEDRIVSVDFPIAGDGRWHTYAVPFYEKFRGLLTQVRLHPAVKAPFRRGASAPNAYRDFVDDPERLAVLARYPYVGAGL